MDIAAGAIAGLTMNVNTREWIMHPETSKMVRYVFIKTLQGLEMLNVSLSAMRTRVSIIQWFGDTKKGVAA